MPENWRAIQNKTTNTYVIGHSFTILGRKNTKSPFSHETIGGDAPLLRAVQRFGYMTPKPNGPYIANGSMRTLRAIYNHARKANKSLPADNPVNAIDWNGEKRRGATQF